MWPPDFGLEGHTAGEHIVTDCDNSIERNYSDYIKFYKGLIGTTQIKAVLRHEAFVIYHVGLRSLDHLDAQAV